MQTLRKYEASRKAEVVVVGVMGGSEKATSQPNEAKNETKQNNRRKILPDKKIRGNFVQVKKNLQLF